MNVLQQAFAFVRDNPALVVQRLLEHVELSAVSLAIGLVLALPVALVLGHTGRGGFIGINVSNVGRALPSLGLIGIGLPIFGLNDRTTIFALVLLAIPPILTNAYVGVRQVDRDAVEAARGMGMSGAEVLRTVELPLAAPVIMAGVRTSAVQVVATATLAAVIAGGGLGRFIIDGFAGRDYPQMVAGAILVALLTRASEAALAAVQRAVTPRGLARPDRRTGDEGLTAVRGGGDLQTG